MRRLSRCLVVSIITFALTGCATMFKEKTQTVSFKTKPSGAEIVLGTQTCTTPCSMTIDKSRLTLPYASVSKDGYQMDKIVLSPRIEPMFWLNALNMGFGCIVDYMSGTAINYEPDYYAILARSK